MALTYRQIQDYAIADAFDESDRAIVKEAINARYGELFDNQQWTFTQGTTNVTVTQGSRAVTNLPTDLGIVIGLERADGVPLRALEDYRDYAARWIGTLNQLTGMPEEYCAWAGALSVGPISSETSSAYTLTYEKGITLLAGDGDVPVIPGQYHLMLVHGAKADVFTLKNILLADGPEAKWNEYLQAMQRKYLVASRGNKTQVPAFRPGRYPYRW